MHRWVIGIAMVSAALPVWGQELQSWYRPVDQAVEDWNAFSVSQRVVDPGNARFSDRVYLFQPLNPYQLDPHGRPAAQSFVYESPGVRAWVQNPEYLSLISTDPTYPEYKFNVTPAKDGAFLSIMSAGSVFDLTLPAPPPTEMDLHPELDVRIDARVRAQPVYARPVGDGSMPPPIVGYGDLMVIEEGVAAPPRVTREARGHIESRVADDEVVQQPRGAQPTGDEGDGAGD